MPYIKPEKVIKAQYVAEQIIDESDSEDKDRLHAAKDVLDVCPVCDSYGCDKSVVKANGVFVHPEDVGNADSIERGELP
jgi:hypothetical protein